MKIVVRPGQGKSAVLLALMRQMIASGARAVVVRPERSSSSDR